MRNSYPRPCRDCSLPIRMLEVAPGRYVPVEHHAEYMVPGEDGAGLGYDGRTGLVVRGAFVSMPKPGEPWQMVYRAHQCRETER